MHSCIHTMLLDGVIAFSSNRTMRYFDNQSTNGWKGNHSTLSSPLAKGAQWAHSLSFSLSLSLSLSLPAHKPHHFTHMLSTSCSSIALSPHRPRVPRLLIEKWVRRIRKVWCEWWDRNACRKRGADLSVLRLFWSLGKWQQALLLHSFACCWRADATKDNLLYRVNWPITKHRPVIEHSCSATAGLC